MVDPIDYGLAFSGKPCENETHRSAKVGRHYRRPSQPGDASNARDVAIDVNIGTHAREFWNMHEAVLENRLLDVRSSLCCCHEGHELCLQVGGKSREWRSRH